MTEINSPQFGIAEIHPTLGNWTYVPHDNFYGNDEFTVVITDDSGSTTEQVIEVNISPVADTPNASGTASLSAITEDTTNSAGDTVFNLFGQFFNDPDGDHLVAVAIHKNQSNSHEGEWQYSKDNGRSWTDIKTGGISRTEALYLSRTDHLRFIPAPNYFGAPGQLEAVAIDSSFTHAESFLSAEVNPFQLSAVKDDANPSVVDIDSDGDLDLFVGDLKGHTYFFENEGTRENPIFSSKKKNAFGLADVGGFASPEFIDIDGDGDQDIFIGNRAGKTLFKKNIGNAENLIFPSQQS